MLNRYLIYHIVFSYRCIGNYRITVVFGIGPNNRLSKAIVGNSGQNMTAIYVDKVLVKPRFFRKKSVSLQSVRLAFPGHTPFLI